MSAHLTLPGCCDFPTSLATRLLSAAAPRTLPCRPSRPAPLPIVYVVSASISLWATRLRLRLSGLLAAGGCSRALAWYQVVAPLRIPRYSFRQLLRPSRRAVQASGSALSYALSRMPAFVCLFFVLGINEQASLVCDPALHAQRFSFACLASKRSKC